MFNESLILVFCNLFLIWCQVSLLGRVNDTDLYEDMDEYANLTLPPRVQVIRFQAPLYYANKDTFLKSIYKIVKVEPFLEMTKRKKAEKKDKQMSMRRAKASGDNNNGDVVVGLVQRELEFHTIVLDCSAMPFIDSSGMAAFKVLVKDYKEIGVTVLLASCNTSVIDTLQKGQLFGKNEEDISSMLFYTVHAAVLHANSTCAAVKSEDSMV